MKKEKILKLLLFIVIIVFIAITVLVFLKKGKTDGNYIYGISNSEERITIEDINYLDEYSSQIINSNVTSYDYELIKNDEYIYGKFYIDSNSILYATDGFKNIERRLTNEKMATLYKVVNNDNIVIYALPEQHDKIYSFKIDNTDLNKIEQKEYYLSSNPKAFTYLKNLEYGDEESSPVILCEDNKMYDLNSGLLYSDKYIKFYKNFILDSNNIIYSYKGYKMYNFANNQYKLVGYVLSKENIFSDNNYVILVTEDGSLLWFNGYDTFSAYNKRVKSIKNIDNKVKILFYDDTYYNFEGRYNKY